MSIIDLPKTQSRVLDKTNTLSMDQLSKLKVKIEEVGKSTNQIFGVLIVNSLEGSTIEELSSLTYKAWNMGENGCLLVISVDEKLSRIETGSTMELFVTDSHASTVLHQILNPHLKKGNFYSGIDLAINELITIKNSYNISNNEYIVQVSNGSSLLINNRFNYVTLFSDLILSICFVFIILYFVKRKYV